MAFLKVNGLTALASHGNVTRAITRKGSRKRSYRGQLRDGRRGVRRSFDLTLVVQEPPDCDAMGRIINGEGHMVDFASGMECATGLRDNPATTRVQVLPGAMGAFGRGVMRVNGSFVGNNNLMAQWDPQFRDDEWTLIIWQKQLAVGGAWRGKALRSDGVGYRNGIRDDTVLNKGLDGTLFARVRDGQVELWQDALGAGIANLDDFVMLPCRLSDAQMIQATMNANGKWGPAPILRLNGDMTGGKDIFCLGEVTGMDYVQRPSAIPGIGWVSNSKVIKATFHELEPAYVAGFLAGGCFNSTPPGAPVWWFDANDVDLQCNATLVDGSAIATWSDKGSLAQNATQATGANQPLFRVAGERPLLKHAPAVQFDGVNDVLAGTVGAAVSGNITTAIVCRSDNVVGGHVVFSSNTNAKIVGHSGTAWQMNAGGTGTHPIETAVVGEWASLLATFNGTAAQPFTINSVRADVNPGTNGAPTGPVLGAASSGGGNLWNGLIAEVIVWNDSSYGTFADVLDYLTRKYGELPQT